MDDPDRGWKPNGRPQSTVARNFMSELDDLFKIEGGLHELDKNVHQKKQAVTTHTQQLEALEARLREIAEREERLKQAKSSPPAAPARTSRDSQRRTPIKGAFSDDKAWIGDSPLAARRNQQQSTQRGQGMPARPRTAQDENEKA